MSHHQNPQVQDPQTEDQALGEKVGTDVVTSGKGSRGRGSSVACSCCSAQSPGGSRSRQSTQGKGAVGAQDPSQCSKVDGTLLDALDEALETFDHADGPLEAISGAIARQEDLLGTSLIYYQ